MVALQKLVKHLDEYLQCSLFRDYCPNGLQVEGKGEVKKIAMGVSASLATIKEAVEFGVDALIVHHGMFWQGDSFVVSRAKREKLRLLIENNISLLGYHLPLDAHNPLGNNWKAAADLGWTDLEPFCEVNGTFYGVKGKVSNLTREDFKKELEEYYDHSAAVALGGPETIRTASLVSGGAYRHITHAIDENLDCFITGNFDEPVWHQAHEESINFFALGHSATEKIGPKALGDYLEKEFGVNQRFIDIDNPF